MTPLKIRFPIRYRLKNFHFWPNMALVLWSAKNDGFGSDFPLFWPDRVICPKNPDMHLKAWPKGYNLVNLIEKKVTLFLGKNTFMKNTFLAILKKINKKKNPGNGKNRFFGTFLICPGPNFFQIGRNLLPGQHPKIWNSILAKGTKFWKIEFPAKVLIRFQKFFGTEFLTPRGVLEASLVKFGHFRYIHFCTPLATPSVKSKSFIQ